MATSTTSQRRSVSTSRQHLQARRPDPGRHFIGVPGAVGVLLGVLIVGSGLGSVAYGCSCAMAQATAEGIRAALENYAADSEDQRYPLTSMIASYRDLVRIVNVNGGDLPDTEEPEPEVEPWWWPRMLRTLRESWTPWWQGPDCQRAGLRHRVTFVRYTSDDGRTYTLLLRAAGVPGERADTIIEVSPAGLTKYPAPTSEGRQSGGDLAPQAGTRMVGGFLPGREGRGGGQTARDEQAHQHQGHQEASGKPEGRSHHAVLFRGDARGPGYRMRLRPHDPWRSCTRPLVPADHTCKEGVVAV